MIPIRLGSKLNNMIIVYNLIMIILNRIIF